MFVSKDQILANIMKNRVFLGLFLSSLIGAFILNGCKATATDPTYVGLAEIRFADYHQVEPLQFFMYPVNANHTDSLGADKTPTPTTYGIITPYITNIPTNRSAGQAYSLVAVNAVSKVVVAHVNVTLHPNDRYTWLVAGNSGTFDQTLINDAPPENPAASVSYFRFINVTPGANSSEDLRVGDPLNGFSIATGITYLQISNYVGVHTALDTSVTLYVVDHNTGVVLGRLSGVSLDSGGYHTVTWGGSVQRLYDQNGNTSLNDTTRIRIWNDDPTQGVDLTYSVPTSFRFNIINALVPPNSPNGTTLIDYSQTNGLALVINNNTSYDYKALQPFSFAPLSYFTTGDGVAYQVPTTIPFNPGTDKIYIKMVEPIGSSPNPNDPILFRFYAGLTGATGQFKSDQLYTIIVFDTVKKSDPKQLDYTPPYDSAAWIATVPVTDVPIAGSARIVYGNMLAPVIKLPATPNKGVFTVSGFPASKKITSPKTYDSVTVPISAGAITITASVNSATENYSVTFTPEDGAIYEAFLVGQRGRSDGKWGPHFIVVRVNPIR